MTRPNGFTLVELLVAMVAGSLLLASLSWMLGNVSHSLKAPAKDRVAAQLSQIEPTLSQLISHIQPPDKVTPPVTANANLISFTTEAPQSLRAAGVITATLSTQTRAEGVALVGQFEGQREGQSWVRQTDLATGFTSISFATQWPTAPEALALPTLITLRFEAPRGTVTTISAAPRLNGGGPCHFDPISMSCRR